MRTAVVTGASSGIGLQISKKLVSLGYKVYGIARDFTKTDFAHEHFIPLSCDITKTKQLCETMETIRKSEDDIHILVNNAGVGFFGPHEQLKPEQIEAMVATNLQAPLIATRLLLRRIKQSQGYIINISSITARKSSTYGCAYAATKAGLTHFAVSLFDEIRKTGVKVVTLHPDMTQTPFYDSLDFREGDLPDSYITAECVANAVETILKQREGTVITEMTIRPQKHQITRKNGMKR
jgi:short-subunit dehydrogenase